MKNKIKFGLFLLILSFYSCLSKSTKNDVELLNKDRLEHFENIFTEIQKYLEKEKGKLWNYKLTGPLLLVDDENKLMVANEKDNEGVLKKQGDIYVGNLSENIITANTSIKWGGKDWTMVKLPLPEDYNDMINLVVHESFHRIQPLIGFGNINYIECSHLDEMNARIYLKLETEALKMALSSSDKKETKQHIKNAILYRKFRYSLHPNAKVSENLLELNEGLAEYTGSILSGRTDEGFRNHYNKMIDDFYAYPTFVRSFAYVTLPVYGYFMNMNNNEWNKDINMDSNLTDYMVSHFDFSYDENLKSLVEQNKSIYNFAEIAKFEKERDIQRRKLMAKYIIKFTEEPVLILKFENMSIGFNPSNLIPLDDYGTVYPDLKITDNWGVLKAENGALLSNKWDKVTVSKPMEINEKIVKGDGWKLELNDGYKVDKKGEDYCLIKL